MSTELETRLRCAGEQIDRQIERHAVRTTVIADPSTSGRARLRLFMVAAAATVVLASGLVWLNADHNGVGPASSLVPSPSVTVVETPTTLVVATNPTSTIPTDQRPPIAVGESVMKGAVPELHAGGFAVYAAESKQAEWVAAMVGQLRAAGQIGSTIVIQCGTNGPVTAEQYGSIMSYLPADEVTTVVFLTVRAPKPWIDANNDLIRALPTKYPNVVVLDWAGLSNQIEGELSTSDGGVHLRTDRAKQLFANYIFSVIGRNDLVVPPG